MDNDKPKHAGRPTKYTPEIIAKAQDYLTSWQKLGDVVPMLAGLACHLEISKQTLHDWENEYPELMEVCVRVRVLQEKSLINKGLSRESDASLSKLLLMKHGYSDRQEVDHSTLGKPITQPQIIFCDTSNTDEDPDAEAE